GMGMSGTYTTLTPLQPLPPISAVSDKFHHPHAHPHAHHHHHHHHQRLPGSASGGLALLRLSPLGNGLGPLPGAQQGLHGYGPPGHDKMLSPNFEAHAAMLARGEQHLPRGLGTPPAMLPPLNGAHHTAPPGPPPPHGPPGCAARRERDADPLLGSNGGCKLLSSLPAPAGIRLLSVRSQMKVPRQAVGCYLCSVSSAVTDPKFFPPAASGIMPSERRVWPLGHRCRLTLMPLMCPGRSIPCKRKEQEPNKERNNSQKKSRLVFTDLQRRTLFAIFKENKRPSKEMQITISQQLGLELTTVSNFFMNARRRSLEKWQDDLSSGGSSSAPSTCTKA
ncbi:ONEC2 protein, partial [Melanocharis versteri]|nr:ONEC2 protein [Melanocharis versteri]